MSATLLESRLHLFEVSSNPDSVDAEKGVIYGVSLITSGISARGHKVDHPDDKDLPDELKRKIDLEIDTTTLDQMLSCAEKKKKLPVKWNHKTGADAISGHLKNFRIVGKKLVGDWHLLKKHEWYEKALELASEMPECLGLSTSFRGKDEVKNDRAYARCTELVSADLVASPAANPDGFFHEVDSGAERMAKPSTPPAANSDTPEKEFSLGDVMAGLALLSGRLATIEERQTSFETALQEAQEFEEEEQEEELAEFSNGAEAIQFLSEKLSGIEDAAEQARVDHAFSIFEDKVEKLTDLNAQLLMENEAMAEAIKEFSERTGGAISFKPAGDGSGYEHSLSIPEDDREAPRTDFEKKCRQFEAEGKDEHEAIRLAMKADARSYQRHLQEIGVMARNL